MGCRYAEMRTALFFKKGYNMAVSSIGNSTSSWTSSASSTSSTAGRFTSSSITRLSTASTSSAGRGDTYTCKICGEKIPVGMTHDQYHALSQPRATSFPSSTSTANTKGQALGSAASRAANAYGSSTPGRATSFNSSTTAWAR